MFSLFGWLVADGWCWFVLREEYCWLVAGGWFVVREKYCCLVADKPSEQGESQPFRRAEADLNLSLPFCLWNIMQVLKKLSSVLGSHSCILKETCVRGAQPKQKKSVTEYR
jgi:hypothetical protein